ncbi:MAG: hypothetical protein EOP47_17675 [Sphingobacteriaceae bacterium]|nr:MAG: hypothetical protein EOP47_17675 [Sphingobacteriaceae bacterium]
MGSKLLGYASIILGALSIVIGLIPFINLFAIVSGIVGLIVGIISMRQARKGRVSSKYALGGMVLSILGIILSFVINSAVLDKITGADEEEIQTETTKSGGDY